MDAPAVHDEETSSECRVARPARPAGKKQRHLIVQEETMRAFGSLCLSLLLVILVACAAAPAEPF